MKEHSQKAVSTMRRQCEVNILLRRPQFFSSQKMYYILMSLKFFFQLCLHKWPNYLELPYSKLFKRGNCIRQECQFLLLPKEIDENSADFTVALYSTAV